MRLTENKLRSIIRNVIREGYEEDIQVGLGPNSSATEIRKQIKNGFGRALAIDYFKKHYAVDRNVDIDDVVLRISSELTDLCSQRCHRFLSTINNNDTLYREFMYQIKKGVMQAMSGKYDAALNLRGSLD
jgi:hypothetical protein